MLIGRILCEYVERALLGDTPADGLASVQGTR